jgi:GNAT superfamily N-acetyltransferase
MTTDLELVELTGRAREFLSLEVAENQKRNVASMAESYADALFPPQDGWENSTTWIRGVTRAGTPAGFIMCSDAPDDEKDPWIWRLLVDREHQGFGVGKFAVECAIARYRSLGVRQLLTAWHPGPNDASGFYKMLGFVETGEMLEGEVVAALKLDG